MLLGSSLAVLITIPKITVRDASEERIHIQGCSAVMRHWVVGIKVLVGILD